MTPPEFSRLVFVQTKLYIEDWIGLRSLDEAGKVKFIRVEGEHLRMSTSDARKYVVPYLQQQPLKLLWRTAKEAQQKLAAKFNILLPQFSI